MADTIWAQYGGKFPTAATEITVAAATADSPSPHHPHNKWAPESVWKTLHERESHRKNQVRIARIFAGGSRGGLHNCALALGVVPMLL